MLYGKDSKEYVHRKATKSQPYYARPLTTAGALGPARLLASRLTLLVDA